MATWQGEELCDGPMLACAIEYAGVLACART